MTEKLNLKLLVSMEEKYRKMEERKKKKKRTTEKRQGSQKDGRKDSGNGPNIKTHRETEVMAVTQLGRAKLWIW